MIAAWVAVAFFLVVLPLAAWWVGGSRFWRRRDAAADAEVQTAELQRAMAREHGLDGAEADQVRRAVTWGRRLDDPRLGAAAVDWAQRLVELDRRRRAERPQLRTWLLVVVVLWVAFVLARVVFAVAQGRWGDVNWLTVAVYAGFAVQGWRRATGPQRAIELNSSRVDP